MRSRKPFVLPYYFSSPGLVARLQESAQSGLINTPSLS